MTETARLVIAVDSTQVGRADADLKKFGQTTTAVDRQSAALAGSLSRLAPVLTTVSAALSVQKMAGYADTWSDLTSRVRLSIGAHESAAVVMSRLSDVARGTYSSLEATAESFAQNSVTLRALGKSTLDQIDYTEALNNALVVSGAKGDRAQMVQNSLAKAMAEGSLRGEELNNVLNSGSRVAELLADELGINITQLRGVAKDGKITGDVIFNSLTKNIQTLKDEAASMPATISDGFLLIGNAVLQSVGVFDQQAKISEELAEKLVTVSDAIRNTDWSPYINAVTVSSKVLAAYMAMVYAGPAASAAFAAGTKLKTAALAAFTVQVNTSTAALTRMQVAQGLLLKSTQALFAAYAGWQIGTYLREEFEIVEKAGIALMSGLHQSAVFVGGLFKEMSETIKFALSNPFDFARGQIADFLEWVNGLGVGALRLLGLEGLADGLKTEFAGIRGATAAEHKATLEQIRSQTRTEMAGISDVYFDMFDQVGKSSGALAGTISDLQGEVSGLGGTLGETSGKTDKQATAFQALYDRLYPAEAAQREYNKQVDLLSKYLSGDQLANAIYRLNHAIEGADATGPADAIEEYRKELERLEDQLDPVGKATDQYRKDVERLDDAMARGEIGAERHAQLLGELEKQYKENTRATSDWAKWTESALDRVDSAFADAWRNIGDGFDSFRDSLTNAFKQMLAELAHMAITKPIIMQIGAMMGVGGGTQGNNGIWGSLLGGGSSSGGGYGIQDGLSSVSTARNAYSLYTAGFAGMANTWGGYLAGAGNMLGMTGLGNFGIGMQGATLAPGLAGPTTVGASGSMGAGAQVGSSLSSMGGLMANPVTWIAAGMLASSKFYDAGYRLDTEDVARQKANKMSFAIDPALSSVLNLGVKTTELATKLLGGGKLANILTGGSLIAGVTGAVDKALFGGAWKTKDYGLGLSIADGDFGARQFEYRKKKGGLFSSSKKKTIWRDLDPETAAALQETFDATEAGVASIFESLSLSVEEGSLAGLQLARKKISTKGKTEEEIQEAIGEWFASAAEAMNAELNRVFGTGLEYDLAGMQAFVGNLQGVNALFEQLNYELYESTVAGGRMAEQLSAVAGGFDALAANVSTYYDAFYTGAEKTANVVESITRAFEDAEVALAGSRAEYRAMVDNIDRTTEAGREMFATLTALSGQAATYYDILEAQLLGAANSAYASLQRSIANQQREIQQQASSATASINALTGISNALDAALKRLRGTSDDAVRSLRAQAVMTLNSALVQARSGQSLAGFAGLQDALDVASQMDTALYSSLTDFEREQGRTANLIAELEKVNGKQLSTEQRMLEKYEQQLSALDKQLAFAQSQLDALNGIDNSIMGVAAAIAAMNASVVAALQGLPKGAAQANTPANNRSIIDTIYQSVLGRGTQGDEAGASFWANALQSGTATYQDIATSIAKGALANAGESSAGKKSAEEYLKSLGIPGFASGGFHSGGAAIVGEKGPELMVTGPARIYNASQTAAMLGGAGSTEELRALRGEVAGLRDALHSIAKHTEKTAHGVEQIKDIGIPQEEAA